MSDKFNLLLISDIPANFRHTVPQLISRDYFKKSDFTLRKKEGEEIFSWFKSLKYHTQVCPAANKTESRKIKVYYQAILSIEGRMI